MSADILTFPIAKADARIPDPMGNGARQALAVTLSETVGPMGDVFTDAVLLGLGMRGFMVVPFDDEVTK
jgi:hypothetical protein